jgi:hypothetical protein
MQRPTAHLVVGDPLTPQKPARDHRYSISVSVCGSLNLFGGLQTLVSVEIQRGSSDAQKIRVNQAPLLLCLIHVGEEHFEFFDQQPVRARAASRRKHDLRGP